MSEGIKFPNDGLRGHRLYRVRIIRISGCAALKGNCRLLFISVKFRL